MCYCHFIWIYSSVCSRSLMCLVFRLKSWLHTRLLILKQHAFFQGVPKLLNFSSFLAPFGLKGKGYELLIRGVCVCVLWSGVFIIRGFDCCSLLWCNTGATDKSKLINGKLLLMIVKTLLSPHVVLGHLSATGWSYRPRHTCTHHTH